MENKWKLSDEAILLFFYGKAVDLWIAEQGTNCLDGNEETFGLVIDELAMTMHKEYIKSCEIIKQK